MYIPNKFKMANIADKHQFIHEFGFGVMISSTDTLSATHLPFVLHAEEGAQGVLYAHCAKANPHWKKFENQNVLVIFSGPHSYISASWYANKPAVPTWNYAAVHAYGLASLLNQKDTLKAVDQAVEKYEPQLLDKGDIISDQLKHSMLTSIVGFKIELTELEGQLKLGQNRNKHDQAGVYNALTRSTELDNMALAKYMQKLNIGCE